MKEFLKQAQKITDQLTIDRRYLHTNPEAGHFLPGTVAYVKKRLAAMGYEAQDIGDHGVTALAGKKDGKVFLLRADMDALPLKEESGLPFASKNGFCHACGHDFHTAMLLGAAALLKEKENQLHGRVKFMFQPAEEVLTGARNQIDAGILENPKVDAAFAIHVDCEQPVGFFGYNKSRTHASLDCFEISIIGKGCHGAMPAEGVDPINVAAHIHIALQEILSREVPARESLVVTVGRLTAGTAMNIIPESAQMNGSIRAFSSSAREFAVRRLEEISDFTARAFRAAATTTWTGAIPSVRSDPTITELILELLRSSGLTNPVFFEHQSMGSEDFAFIAEKIPSSVLSLGAALEDKSRRFGLHNPKVVFDEDCLPIGAAVYAAIASSWLSRNKE